MIGIIDYGMGNLRSVQKAFESLHVPVQIIRDPGLLSEMDGVVLPGVGAFRDAIAELDRQKYIPALQDYVTSGRPLLGICLGLQLLFERSYEDGDYRGLGFISGDVVRFESQPGLKIPHMGWNSLEIQGDHPLLAETQTGDNVYFVHSYYVRPQDDSIVIARTDYGGHRFACMVAQNNVMAAQFHPEKSQKIGLQILKNFSQLVLTPAS